MGHKSHCCKNRGEEKSGVSVTVNVNVERIVRPVCMAGVLIVAIIFGASTFKAFLEKEGKGIKACE